MGIGDRVPGAHANSRILHLTGRTGNPTAGDNAFMADHSGRFFCENYATAGFLTGLDGNCTITVGYYRYCLYENSIFKKSLKLRFVLQNIFSTIYMYL